MQHGFIKVAAASPQIRVADCIFNEKAIIDVISECSDKKVKLLVLPELCITGYTCGDLFFQNTLLDCAEKALINIAKATKNKEMIVFAGCPLRMEGKLYNCTAGLYNGEIICVIPKSNIPDYGEFCESRYFALPQEDSGEIKIGEKTYPFGTKLLLSCRQIPDLCISAEICEDLWAADSPAVKHSLAGATVIVNPAASSESAAKSDYRRDLVKIQSAKLISSYIFAGAGEGESTTDLVFAGHRIIAENGSILAEGEMFENAVTTAVIDVSSLAGERRRLGFVQKRDGYKVIEFSMKPEETDIGGQVSSMPFIPSDKEQLGRRCREILNIQVNGLKKRLKHTNAKTAVIGVSGGLDSCLALLVTAFAVDSLGLGRDMIKAITMPCFGTTDRTKSNAVRLCEELDILCETIDIFDSVTTHLKEIGHDINETDVVYENAQARQRTMVLMDIANKTGGMVIGTGDLSELALGWATYNGDHMSMYGVNSSVPKTLVRHLTKYCADTTENEALQAVLYDILDTPVSPELLPAQYGDISQRTEDIVGPYELHDFYLYYGIRWGFSPEKVYRMACSAFEGIYYSDTILKWLENFYRRFFSQQFKRSCMPDGPKTGTLTLSPRGDWRMPSDACSAVWMEEIKKLKK